MPRAGQTRPPVLPHLPDRIAIGVLTGTFPPELVDRVIASRQRATNSVRGCDSSASLGPDARNTAWSTLALGGSWGRTGRRLRVSAGKAERWRAALAATAACTCACWPRPGRRPATRSWTALAGRPTRVSDTPWFLDLPSIDGAVVRGTSAATVNRGPHAPAAGAVSTSSRHARATRTVRRHDGSQLMPASCGAWSPNGASRTTRSGATSASTSATSPTTSQPTGSRRYGPRPSAAAQAERGEQHHDHREQQAPAPPSSRRRPAAPVAPLAGPLPGQARSPRRGAAHLDRKSTRLNSSHVRISYAVFCLKKKKKKLQPLRHIKKKIKKKIKK